MQKARAAGADVVMPWSAATGLLGRLLNARGDMGWNVPVVGHPAVMAAQIRKLLNKPEYWDQHLRVGLRQHHLRRRRQAAGSHPAARRQGPRRSSFRAAARSISSSGGSRWATTTVKIIEHAVKTAGSTDPAAIQKAMEGTSEFKGVYGTYGWGHVQARRIPRQRDDGQHRQYLQGRQLQAGPLS
jgi:branched-chain amino acid transport system substrate-binding protein